ncbi:hypothetical protein AGDE_01538 [Angomonas deanei]|uniref:Rhodanese-like domain containing protein, putative n=1 Tax=Angomonas deanei TaxID=59799 RepID=A0A7G2C731_9TRYP|nr:hypothetical protein AGDE_01538 [Angomonas deanei]CAD2214563.1 Rhodanese-like domain containing protein, putative [Angomonas deanei]|eukprot:EPY42385.1 hypothetical protein AGDE_01538 [Angomonas deanei]
MEDAKAEASILEGEAAATTEGSTTNASEGWPEPTLEDLDRSIPQVDCEFIANLIRCRTVRRQEFLERKEVVKQKAEEMTKKEAKTVSDTTSFSRLGGLTGLWRSANLLGDQDENDTAAGTKESAVVVSDNVLAALTPEERDLLETTRPEYNDGFILIDCRTVNEVTSWGIIEGAKVLPAHELFEAFHKTPEDFHADYGFAKPTPDETIICYCQFGPRSLMAAQILSWMGYLKVLHFRDGFYEWGKQYNLLLRRWMEHDKSSGNELRRLAAFQAGLELQREIAPEFNALPMQEAAKYRLDQTRSRGTLLIGEGLRVEAYAKVAQLLEGLPVESREKQLDTGSGSPQHLTRFLEQTTGVNPVTEEGTELLEIGAAQEKSLETHYDPTRSF